MQQTIDKLTLTWNIAQHGVFSSVEAKTKIHLLWQYSRRRKIDIVR